MKNKSIENKFKKLILTWWFWVIIAIVAYFIFASIPIQWTGNGLEIEEGTGVLKTFFAYFTQIAWIIAVALLIFAGIKAIQKSKIGEYWKIFLTILGIIGIIAYVYFSLSGMGIFNNFTEEYDERIGELDEDKVRLIKGEIKILEGYGYEIISFRDWGGLEDEDVTPYLEMKSLRNRQFQLEDGLYSLSWVYPNAPEYIITILEPTQECWYFISGDSIRKWGIISSLAISIDNVTCS